MFERLSLQELAGTPYIQDGVLVKRATNDATCLSVAQCSGIFMATKGIDPSATAGSSMLIQKIPTIAYYAKSNSVVWGPLGSDNTLP
ncbi:hypothetical protein N7499_007366 [Penicillium canescens]|nr:hypothetical protein N7522_007978 [Penicillium canescens]KAJ6082492.1 hypothetical protein N7499_007366 [Penicillium canescens]KAJ6175711.1 hypothetical protein N7485_002625 [Penicillium canescens]